MGSGSCNLRLPASGGNRSKSFLAAFPNFDPAAWAGVIAVFIVIGIILAIVLLYINSRMRFVLFDSIVAKECRVGEFWGRRGRPAMRYFVWQILYMLVAGAGLLVVIGIPALAALNAGWFKAPREHLAPLILGGLLVFFLCLGYFVVAMTVVVFTKDFVVPQMALEDLSAVEGWRRLWPMLAAEKAGFTGYAALKVVLAIAAALIVAIAFFILLLFILIPAGGLGFVAVIAAKGAGVTWNPLTIALAAAAITVVVAVLFYLSAMIAVPAIVFFPAYSIYFFASRYPALSAVLYPAPPPVPPLSPGPVPSPV
jgi:hypothetical protein